MIVSVRLVCFGVQQAGGENYVEPAAHAGQVLITGYARLHY